MICLCDPQFFNLKDSVTDNTDLTGLTFELNEMMCGLTAWQLYGSLPYAPFSFFIPPSLRATISTMSLPPHP
jgi:hypothetical protein